MRRSRLRYLQMDLNRGYLLPVFTQIRNDASQKLGRAGHSDKGKTKNSRQQTLVNSRGTTYDENSPVNNVGY